MPEDFSLGDDPRGGVEGRDGWFPARLRRLRQALAPTTALRAPTRPALGRLAIALLGLPAPPPGGRLSAAVAAVPGLGGAGREGLAAAFQQTLPRSRPRRPPRRLPWTGIWPIVGRAHGRGLPPQRVKSRRRACTLSSEANARLRRTRLPPHRVTLLKNGNGCHGCRAPHPRRGQQTQQPPATQTHALLDAIAGGPRRVADRHPHSRLGQSPAVPAASPGPGASRPNGPVSNRRQ